MKIMLVMGTRPEAIKMAPLIKEIEKNAMKFEPIVVVTGQHREMLDQVLEVFDIKPDYDLDIMKKNQSLTELTGTALRKLDDLLKITKPDLVLVHGDTTTAYVAALAAFYNQIKIGHVEAGLRTWDITSPFPEESNRQMIDNLSDLYFVPTSLSKENLLAENKKENKIFITGNTVIDALRTTVQQEYSNEVLSKIPNNEKFILLTMHRRENIGQPMRNVFLAIKKIIEDNKSLHLIYPVHLNPKVREIANEILGSHPRIHLIEPLNVIDFHNFMSKSYFIMSDSGGIQEEAPSFNIPVFVLRKTTERPEGVESGTLKLIGTEYETVLSEINNLLCDKKEYEKMANAINPYGDGYASKRIVSEIANYFQIEFEKISEFESK